MMAGEHLQPEEKRNECLVPVQGQQTQETRRQADRRQQKL